MLIGIMNGRDGNNRFANIAGATGWTTVNNNSRNLVDFWTFNERRNNEQFFKHKVIDKFTCEAKGLKSIVDYFITSMRISNVIHNIRVYRSNKIDSVHYLLRAEVYFPPRWIKNSNKNTTLKQEEILK